MSEFKFYSCDSYCAMVKVDDQFISFDHPFGLEVEDWKAHKRLREYLELFTSNDWAKFEDVTCPGFYVWVEDAEKFVPEKEINSWQHELGLMKELSVLRQEKMANEF